MPKLVITDREYLGMSKDQIIRKLERAGFDLQGEIKVQEEPFKNKVTFSQEGAGSND